MQKKYFRICLCSILLFPLLLPAQQNKSIIYIYPAPNSSEVRPQTNIIYKIDQEKLLLINLDDISIQVTGSESGLHTGSVIKSDNSIIFSPHSNFATSEVINVKFRSPLLGYNDPLVYNFVTSPIFKLNSNILYNSDPFQETPETTIEPVMNSFDDSPRIINGISVPSDFPILTNSVNNSNSPGKLFITNNRGKSFYLMILEADGTPHYYQKIKNHSADFKVQENGLITSHSVADYGFVVKNTKYETERIYKAQNGLIADFHDFKLTENGNALLIACSYRNMDLSTTVTGGSSDALVIGNIIQELDADQNVIFEWSTFDHFNITDATHENLTDNRIDYVHINSIETDYDKNILISSRHLSECTKIDRQTGDIIWRLGGKNNQFEFINEDLNFSYQHAFYPVKGKPDHYTIFDNGNHRGEFTRVVEYKIDPQNKTAEKVWEFRNSPDYYAQRAGSAQRLANGNTLINFEQPLNPKIVEVSPSGEILHQANLSPKLEAYKAFKFEWEGMADKPYLISELMTGAVRLIFNKFGDENVIRYNVYGGPIDEPADVIVSTVQPWADIDLRPFSNMSKYFFRVTAMDEYGNESDYSNVESVLLESIYNGYSNGILGSSANSDECDPERTAAIDGFAKALSFDGTDDYVDCGNDISLQIEDEHITLEAWIKVNQFALSPEDGVILGKDVAKENNNAGYFLSCGGNGVITFGLGNRFWYKLATPENSILEDKWYHIAATYDGNFQKIYIDGNLCVMSEQLHITIANTPNRNLFLGRSASFEEKHFCGLLDEVKIWNISRSEYEIQSTMNSELGADLYLNPDCGLVGYWQFNEEFGQVTEDLARDNNFLLNGRFDLDCSFWDFIIHEELEVDFSVGDSCYLAINIENGGRLKSEIQLKQENIFLEQNKSYTLEFDAWSDAAKLFDIKIRQASSPWTDYGRIGAAYSTRVPNHFSYNFTMMDPSDNFAELVFCIGGNNANFYIDNIKLVPNITTASESFDRDELNEYSLIGNYPNPFNPSTVIEYYLPERSNVRIMVYNILGELVSTLLDTSQPGGLRRINFSGADLSSGVYFYNISAKSEISSKKFFKTGKMLLLK